jgi:hypothetical protein
MEGDQRRQIEFGLCLAASKVHGRKEGERGTQRERERERERERDIFWLGDQ